MFLREKRSIIVFACGVFLLYKLPYTNCWHKMTTKYNLKSSSTFNENVVVVVGAGLSGAVMAYLPANLLNKNVLVIEKRSHIGGNCYDYINEVGIRVSKYGAHLPNMDLFGNLYNSLVPGLHMNTGKTKFRRVSLHGEGLPKLRNMKTENLKF